MKNINKENKMTIQQRITKAKSVFVWVNIYDGDGEYIETSKAKLVNALRSRFEDLDESKFICKLIQTP